MSGRILVVDDEQALVRLITYNLNKEGYTTVAAYDGNEAWRLATGEKFDLIILDLMLPGKDGLDICRELRREKIYTPIIMLTARNDEIDRVLGLELGADDYVTKPFSVRELIARVKAILRRRHIKPETEGIHEELTVGSFTVRPAEYTIYKDGHRLDLTLKEYEILALLIRNRGRVLKRDYLLETIWDYDDSISTRVLDVMIGKLREKIETDSRNPRYIKTMRGVGYKFEDSDIV